MKNRLKPVCALIVWSYFAAAAPPARAQSTTRKAATWQALQVSNAIQNYKQVFSGPNSPVYQGYQYIPYINPVVGNAFYPSNEWHTGSVYFKGAVYHRLPLLYDILKDQLVLQSANGQYRIHLDQKDVRWFTLDSLYFVHLEKERSEGLSGYFEQLVRRDPAQLLAKRAKTVIVPTIAGQPRSFHTKNTYYIKRGDSYFKVRNRRSLLKALSDEKKMVRRYLRSNKLRFGNRKELTIRSAVLFYNRIKKEGF